MENTLPKYKEATELVAEFCRNDRRIAVKEIMAEAKKRKIPRKSMKIARNSYALSTVCINGEYYWEDDDQGGGYYGTR